MGAARCRAASAPRADPTGVESEPVHAPEMARVLDLHAAVHHHAQTASLGDRSAFGADHVVLAPQRLRPRAYRFTRDLGHRVRRAEDIDTSIGKGIWEING